MKLSSLLKDIEIAETNLESFDYEVGSVCDDSRLIKAGDVFISLSGNSYNGHEYIGEALLNGAAVAVIDNKSFTGDFPYIRVPSARRAYAQLWNNLCKKPSQRLKFIAVTGTNGKSSVVTMIAHILNYNGISARAIGTLNSELTTPDPPRLYPRLKELADTGIEYAVLEASSHALEYEKIYPLPIKVGVFTNLTSEHLDFHKNMRSYAKAKSKLFSGCEVGIYNYDDKYGEAISRNAKNRSSFSFCCDSADYVCRNMKVGLDYGEFDFLTVGELFRIRLPLGGRFSLYNAMTSVCVARHLGIEKEGIKKAMAALPPISGRLEEIKLDGADYRVFIDYAHTPDALSKVLSTLRECMSKPERLICVFGCGGNRDRKKRAPMGQIATTLADRVIITSDNSRNESVFNIIRDILSGVDKTKPYTVIPERKGAIRYVIHSAQKGDVIVFCGKGHESYEINSYGKIPFSEKDIIKEAHKERIGNKDEHNSC